MDYLQILLSPFSWLLKFLADMFGSYGIALILFALIVKIILFPLSLKGKKSMISMNMLNGRMKEIQKRCGSDKDRYNREVQELYAKEKINPMGGCLWSMLPLPFLMVLYAVIRRPFRYLMGMTNSTIIAIAVALGWADFTPTGYHELTLAAKLNPSDLATVQAAAGANANLTILNFHFLGVDLSQIPNWKFWESGITWSSVGLFLIPITSAILAYCSMIISNKTNKMNKQAMDNPQMKSMMYMSPLMSLWIGFTLPAALGVYWIANNIFQMGQELISGRLLKADYEKAIAAQEEQARLEKEEEKHHKQLVAEKRAASAEETKNKKSKKIVAPVKKTPGVNVADSRVGLRSYARGRAYDPNRFGSATEYKDPNFKVDEAAMQAVIDAKEERIEETRLNANMGAEFNDSLNGEREGDSAEEAFAGLNDEGADENIGDTLTSEETEENFVEDQKDKED
jgi:YidC/Oxa1 family membrane protein insertase